MAGIGGIFVSTKQSILLCRNHQQINNQNQLKIGKQMIYFLQRFT